MTPSFASPPEVDGIMGDEAATSASVYDATVTVLPMDADPHSAEATVGGKKGPLSIFTRRSLIVTSAVLFFAIAAVVLVASLYGTGTIGSTNASSSSAAAAAAAAAAASSSGGGSNHQQVTEEYRERYTKFRTTLLQHTNPTAFTNPSSPQSKALAWLVVRDEALVTDEVTDERLLQRYAIMTIYYACGGEEWKGLLTPLDEQFDKSECLYRGIHCDDQGRIVKIKWYGANVAGELPEEIGLLTHLEELDLSRNLLQGTIPDAILTKLTNLERLYLDANEFTSTISPEIENLHKLEEFDVNSNYLTGPWPTSLTNLTTLKSLSIARNDITGPIFNYLGSWPYLEELWVDESRVSGTLPSDVGTAVPRLRVLAVTGVDLSGSLPTTFAMLTRLEELALVCPNLDATLPTYLGLLTDITSLTFSQARGDGTIPTELGLMTKLESLVLEDNLGLTGTVPQELENLVRLEKLILSRNNLSGTLSSGLGKLSKLELAEFMGNPGLTGNLDFLCFVESLYYECFFECSCCQMLCDSAQFNGNRPPQRD